MGIKKFKQSMIAITEKGIIVSLVIRYLFSILVGALVILLVLFLYIWLVKDGRTDVEKLEDRFTTYWNEEAHHDTCNTMFATDQTRLYKAVDKAYFAHREFRTVSISDLETTGDYLYKYRIRFLLPDFWLENYDKGLHSQHDLFGARYQADLVFKRYIDMEVAVECENLNAPLTDLSREAIRSKVLNQVQTYPLSKYFGGLQYMDNFKYSTKEIMQEIESKKTWSQKVGVYFCQRLQEAGGNNTSCPAEQW